jgi:hypothetical protein
MADLGDKLDEIDKVLLREFIRVYSMNPQKMEDELRPIVEGDRERGKEFFLGYRRALVKAMKFIDPTGSTYQALSLLLGYATFKLYGEETLRKYSNK